MYNVPKMNLKINISTLNFLFKSEIKTLFEFQIFDLNMIFSILN